MSRRALYWLRNVIALAAIASGLVTAWALPKTMMLVNVFTLTALATAGGAVFVALAASAYEEARLRYWRWQIDRQLQAKRSAAYFTRTGLMTPNEVREWAR